MTIPLLVHKPPRVEMRADGILFYRSPPAATPESIKAFFDDMARLTGGTGGRLLVDVREHESIDAAVRSIVYRRGAELKPHRIAVIAESRLHRAMVRFTALASRVDVQCFNTAEEATQWLKS